jgi:NADP-dependent 3-hydroxy acid dehydrogenase YdfG
MSNEDKFRGKVAWITGGATGIGLACAQLLGRAGWRLALSGRREDALARAVTALAAEGIDAQAYPLDVADGEAVERIAKEIAQAQAPATALVCSAGTNVPNRRWDQLTPQAFARVTAINLSGVAYCVTAALPGMRAAGGGSIVVVSSWAGWRYLPLAAAAYGASKQGLSPLVESINDQECHHGVRATLLCPGEVATEILKTRPVQPAPEEIARMLRAEDVAQAALYAIQAPPHVCLNEIVITPSWNRFYTGVAETAPQRLSIPT